MRKGMTYFQTSLLILGVLLTILGCTLSITISAINSSSISSIIDIQLGIFSNIGIYLVITGIFLASLSYVLYSYK